ncbi:MAG: helicase-related protein [Deltaproteobacteria bacterium]|nr:helicase-related protein [Myxococcales bacterium]MDP3214637.1 helicase-related protein [Deltaproteobacteria bacterium]
MISFPDEIDLGRDRTRIKDPRDAERQRQTATALLDRFFHQDPDRRWELQLVADEVGMGKTFVALATAYAILKAMHEFGAMPADLAGCQRKVLIIAPNNGALVSKWQREVGEFIKRCCEQSGERSQYPWFRAGPVLERLDDLAVAMERSDGPAVLITHMGVLGSSRLVNYDVKRRQLLGNLFPVWGNRLSLDARERLLKGAPEGWPRDPSALLKWTEDERARLAIRDDGVLRQGLERLQERSEGDPGRGLFYEVLARCKEVSEPYTRNRDELFKRIEDLLGKLYRHACFAAVSKALPLVIVDEAHNWKNGPRGGTNGYRRFAELIAPSMRRALLLTATPFQLHPDEMLELLKAGEAIAPAGTRADSRARTLRLERQRTQVIAPVLRSAATRSRAFERAWGALAPHAVPGLATAWGSDSLTSLRVTLRDHAHAEGPVDANQTERLIEGSLPAFDPDLRGLLREGLRLYCHNEDLSQELGQFVIRHRRRADHRLVRVGSEYVQAPAVTRQRSDRSVLHVAAGIDVRGEGELPHYLLMRAVSLLKGEKGRSSLGSALTGCYSTLFESAEGRLMGNAAKNGRAAPYIDVLRRLTGTEQDPAHPKVRAVVDAVVERWRAGEKSLLFCFRSHTAKRLHEILDARITRELDVRREALGGGPDALTRLRSRFTRREGDLVPLGLDRLLWSMRWASESGELALPEIGQEDLRLTETEMGDLARLSLLYDVDLQAEQVDRVFVHRATEHLLASRLQRRGGPGGRLFKDLIREMARPAWIEMSYGSEGDTGDAGASTTDGSPLDERGVHTVYRAGVAPSDEALQTLVEALLTRRERARRNEQASIFDAYADGPSFWFGVDPERALGSDANEVVRQTLTELHGNLLSLTRESMGFDWRERRMVFQALRRALMRESVLLRLLPERSELDEQGWGELLVEQFFEPLPGQRESMAERLSVFVEDLRAASGDVYREGTERNALYEATRMKDSGFVVLVDGGTSPDRRKRVFAGFNSPLLPEVLICTSVGQEGIDLHRHCRHVVHYDLAWNPAVLEQRTGRVDRIGSKTFRERAAVAVDGVPAELDVGVPFLAATYDERMYEELRVRAQTFEVLTGGDVARDNVEGEEGDNAEGEETGLALPALPLGMVNDLRVRLHVWEEVANKTEGNPLPTHATFASELIAQ